MYKLEWYQRHRGDCPALEFLESLPKNVEAKTWRWLRMLETQGPNSLRPYADIVEAPIRELRVRFGRLEPRILYFIHESSIVITNGFLKKTDQIPREEIAFAIRCRLDWIATHFGGQA